MKGWQDQQAGRAGKGWASSAWLPSVHAIATAVAAPACLLLLLAEWRAAAAPHARTL